MDLVVGGVGFSVFAIRGGGGFPWWWRVSMVVGMCD